MNKSFNDGLLLNNKVFIVEVVISEQKYYLADYDFSLSKSKKDCMLFTNENNAYKIASIIETKYPALAKVGIEEIKNIIF